MGLMVVVKDQEGTVHLLIMHMIIVYKSYNA